MQRDRERERERERIGESGARKSNAMLYVIYLGK